MNLIIEIGNSKKKLYLFDGEKGVFKESFESGLESKIKTLQLKYSFTSVILSASGIVPEQLMSWVGLPVLRFNHTISKVEPIYEDPSALGNDRLALLNAAYFLYSGEDVLIIDAGTCVTIDVMVKNTHQGGSIHPGLAMRYKALHNYTNGLPRVAPHGEVELAGIDTKSSIQSGVENGIAVEIEGIIERWKIKYPNLKVILTGGDSSFFESKLKSGIFVEPDFQARGLNRILLLNEKK